MTSRSFSDDPVVKLTGALSEPEAEMWRELLANEGIVAMVKNMSAFLAHHQLPFSNSFDLFVRESDLARAQELLAPTDEPGEDPVR